MDTLFAGQYKTLDLCCPAVDITVAPQHTILSEGE
jgi:hypothetical protein